MKERGEAEDKRQEKKVKRGKERDGGTAERGGREEGEGERRRKVRGLKGGEVVFSVNEI